MADHVVPHAVGGGSGEDNLVTTCQCCNYGKGDRLLAEVGLIDPRTRPPVVDAWDGLGRLLLNRSTSLAAIGSSIATPPAAMNMLTTPLSDGLWFVTLDSLDPGLSERLLTFLSDCEPLGVSWGLKDHLIIRLTVGQTRLQICGVAPNGEVLIPWLIGKQKNHFRGFAETIASALPEAHIHESPTQWIVTKDGKNRLHVRDLMSISTVLQDAISDLTARIRRCELGSATP